MRTLELENRIRTSPAPEHTYGNRTTDLARSGNEIEAMRNDNRTIYVIYLIVDSIATDIGRCRRYYVSLVLNIIIFIVQRCSNSSDSSVRFTTMAYYYLFVRLHFGS